MTLWVKRPVRSGSIWAEYHEASLRDKLIDRGWEPCQRENCGRGHNLAMGPPHLKPCSWCACPDCVEGLEPPEGMVEFVRQETMRGDRLTFSQTTIRSHLLAAARWEREQ